MYRVIVDQEIIDVCDKIDYIRYKEETDSWISCSDSEAEAISVKGEKYNIFGKDTLPDRPKAIISEEEAATFIKNTTETLENTQLEIDVDLDYRITCLELGLT